MKKKIQKCLYYKIWRTDESNTGTRFIYIYICLLSMSIFMDSFIYIFVYYLRLSLWIDVVSKQIYI